ncbi:LOW QUALITY PROTEIN: DNA cross-link repair 1A protein-like [Pecten maximus]|uniref:LOW QUALITY PROTEIN: DNA cross-link repair 1A protein-like n=1 Tax=Pecten maximus TaxID=6579 RepID=UPI001458C70A|nr:LOW QUALITY PROTEIN: DNA cross-link repair 1A protein-like [Pecten maximus]
MKRSVPKLLIDDDSEDEIWGYKSLKREKRDPVIKSQNDRRSQARFSGRAASGRLGNNKKLPTKAQEKDIIEPHKQLKKQIKKEDNRSKYAVKCSRTNEKTPSKKCRPELIEGFCPHCQVPYSALSFKSPTWHINECLVREMATKECPAGLSCDNTLPSHYWKFSHWQLAQLRGSGKRIATSVLDHQKDEQHSSRVKVNLFDENQPGHSKNLSSESKNSDVTTSDPQDPIYKTVTTLSTVPVHNHQNSRNTSITSENYRETDDEKDLDEMLANAFGEDSEDSTGSTSSALSIIRSDQTSKSDSNVVITKETFGLQLDEGISFSPQSSPRGELESPVSVKSFSQVSLNNYVKLDSDLKKISSSPSQNQLPLKTPTKSRPSSARKCSNKKSNNRSVEKTADSESPRMASSGKKTRRNTGKKKTETGDIAEESPGTNQPSVRSFFKSLNAKKILFKKSGENTSLLHDSNCVQVTPVNTMKRSDSDKEKHNGQVCIGETAVIDGNSDKDDPNFVCDHHKTARTEVRCKKDPDLSKVKEEMPRSDKIVQKCTAKENTDNVAQKCTVKENKSQTMAKNNKNAFSVLMDKSKSQSASQSTTSPIENRPGKVDAMALVMKAKQWGRDRNTVVQSTSTKPEDDQINLKIPKPEKKQWGGQRQCPFYKKMPGTGITVDAFSFGTIPDCSAYFLSHFHYDHYRGLTKKFKHPIYCSKITANLVERRLKIDRQYLHALPMDCPTVVEGVEVTLLEANHCPGSVLFLFKLKGGRTYLHTGDFRACTEMERYPALNGVHINQLYLDTTYCDPSHTFPPQQDVIDFAVSTVHKKLKENMKTLIICGSYTIGKERIFTAIAKALNSKICVTREKKSVLDCLEDSKLQEIITLSPNEAKVHVLPMAKLNQKALTDYMATMKNYAEVLAFEPTGWTHSNKITSLDQLRPKFSRNGIHIYGVPYSEHSSYLEMKRFTQHLKPDKILPTVNNGNSRARTKMEELFKSWMEEVKMSKKNQNLSGSKQGTLSSWTT